MTREEIIERLREYELGHADPRAAYSEFWGEVIKALSQEPCRYWQNGKCNGNTEVCDDAISREALIAKLTELIKTSRSTIEIKAKLIPMIEQLPSVTQKSGHWLRTPLLTCDKCNKINKSGEETDFCPNCGCRMVDPQEGSDKETSNDELEEMDR